MSVSISWKTSSGVQIGNVQGRIDSRNAHIFNELIESGTEDKSANLILDMQDLSYISSAGLRILLIFARKYKESGRMFGLCSLPETVREVMEISGFNRIVTIHSSETESIRASLGEEIEVEEQKQEVEQVATGRAIDREILSEKFSDLAAYTIQKHESISGETLSTAIKEQASTEIEEELFQIAVEIKRKLRYYRKLLFHTADDRLKKAIES